MYKVILFRHYWTGLFLKGFVTQGKLSCSSLFTTYQWNHLFHATIQEMLNFNDQTALQALGSVLVTFLFK